MVILDRSTFDFYEKSGRLRDISFAKEHRWVKSRYGDAYIFDVPCGHCINCRLNYAKKWSQRCLLESKSWSDNYFVTLTYDDDHLPVGEDLYEGEAIWHTLEPKDVQKFIKDLREYYRQEFDHIGIRFFMCGEYGDISCRPHYHLILFNLPINDLKFYSKSALGDMYYNSPTLERIWKKGHVVVGEVTAQSVAYTARYVQKKASKKVEYDALGIHREYVNMSRRPGIALPYLQANVGKIYENDLIYLPDGQTCKPMRYFDNKAEELGIDVDAVKDRRLKIATLVSNEKVDLVSKDYLTYLDDLENEFQRRSKALKRNMC